MILNKQHRALIQEAFDRTGSEFTVEKVERDLDSGLACSVSSDTSIIIFSTSTSHIGKSLNILAAGGKMDELLNMLKKLELSAKSAGVCRVVVMGRPGWERVIDYKKTAVLLVKEL